MSWQFALRGEGTDTLELDIYGQVGESFWYGGVSAQYVRQVLKQNSSAKNIKVRINSPGGDVIDGFAIYNLLKEHSAKVSVSIDALAASMASVIALAGDTISIAANAFYMIHNPWGVGMGESTDLRSLADLLDKMRDNIADVYVARSGLKRDEVLSMMDAETWLTGEEAKAKGFVDSVVENKPGKQATTKRAAMAFAMADSFANVPAELREAVESQRSQQRKAIDGENGGSYDPTKPLTINRAAFLGTEEEPSDETTTAEVTPDPFPKETPVEPDAESEDEEPPPAAAEERAEPTNSPALPSQETTPEVPEIKMTIKSEDSGATPSVARALGLPAGSTESDIITAAARSHELEVQIIAITGVSMSTEALGAVRALKELGDKVAGISAELATVKSERDKQNFEALKVRGTASPAKLSPATVRFYEERFDAANKDGRGADVVNELTGFLNIAPPIVAERKREPAPHERRSGNDTALVWNGKAWADLKPMERHRLWQDNGELYDLMRSEHEASQRA